MTTIAPPQPPAQVNHLDRRRNVDFFQSGISSYTEDKLSNGNTQVHGLRVFRSGTFRDSLGIQHTWDNEHMDQFVANFNMLSQRGILPNVPVRDGHRSFLGGGGTVIGYVSSLSTEDGTDIHGESCRFLVADFEITDPAALEKLKNGTFRARSAEVGMYEDNREALYYPVFQGFAFVDIPAVEGLYAQGVPQSVTLLEENRVTTPAPNTGVPAPGTQTTQPPAQQQHSAPPPPPPAPAHQFTVFGQNVSDFAAVQAHIDSLELFRKETIETGRKAFCKELAESGRILASDLTKAETAALAMNDSSFTAWRDAMNLVQPSSVTQRMGNPSDNTGQHSGGQNPGSTGVGTDPKADRVAVLEQTLHGLKVSGMSEDKLHNTGAWKELQRLQSSTNAA
jgi:hypothetical protein